MSSRLQFSNKAYFKTLFKNLSDFKEFELRVSKLSTTKEVGDAFEIFVEAYLHTQVKMQAKNVWLVGQIPLRIRRKLNLPSDSKGIDGIFETRDGELVPYQVKFRSTRDVLPYGEVSSFLGITERSCNDRVIFTNAKGLSKDVENRDGLRSVRAADFNRLTKEDFKAIEFWLNRKPIKRQVRKPRGYQQEAVESLVKALRNGPRATAVMACGTGKTLVALWTAEALEPRTVLVLVPSLALLSQTLPDWCQFSKWGDDFEFMCVCSDPTVARGADAFSIRPQEADFKIDTNPAEVRRFLRKRGTAVKVIFSTYQSAPVVAKAMRGLKPFDVGIFDEAHKTTGPKAGLFSFALSDKKLAIKKRLFLTATPRHYDIKRRNREGDFHLVSMDDERVYGPVAYKMSFAAAVKKNIICPYKIVISITTKAEVDAWLLKNGITLVKRNKVQARWAATQIALKRAIQKTKASKVITFHSRVALAEAFAAHDATGVQQFLKGFEVLHVNGKQSAADREALLGDFKTSEKGLVTNARCLTEGVDVPAVDMVAFVDPKRSKVDIAQATGRAMRQSKITGKTAGYIVVPLFLEQAKGESEEAALRRSGFDSVAMVVAAMLEQDEELVEIISQLRREKGEGLPFRPRRLQEKIDIIGPSISLEALKKSVNVSIRDKLAPVWFEMYGHLLAFERINGTSLVPARLKLANGLNLGSWVSTNRLSKCFGNREKQKLLEAIPSWQWDLKASRWERGFQELLAYKTRHKNIAVPKRFVTETGFPLYNWIRAKRGLYSRGKLPDRQVRQLSNLEGWTWSSNDSAWLNGLDKLKQFSINYGHADVPQNFICDDGFALGTWVSHQRHSEPKNTISDFRKKSLESSVPGWTWRPLDTRWQENYDALVAYKNNCLSANVPQAYVCSDGRQLGAWVAFQRRSRKRLSSDRSRKLESLAGWVWDAKEAKWLEAYEHLLRYSNSHGDCHVPIGFRCEDGFRLGAWVYRNQRNKNRLTKTQVQKLSRLRGWQWGPRRSFIG